MATSQGNRISDTILITLTATVAAKNFVQLDGTLSGAGQYGFPSLEGGDSGQKIAAGIAGVGVVLAGAAGVTAAGDRIASDASGLAVTYASGVSLGVALNAATSGQEVQYVIGAA